MSREITLEMPFEVPANRMDATHTRMWLESVRDRIGFWGEGGRDVGVGFVWYTRRGLGNARLPVITRRIKRSLKSARVVDALCDPYNLEQRIVYVRDGEGHGFLSLKED